MIRRALASSILALVVLAGCRTASKSASQASAGAGVTVYHVRGKIVATDPKDGIVDLDGDAIPGFMEAMTMPYQVKNPAIIAALHPGDTITAKVLVSKNSQQTILLDDIDIVAQAKPARPGLKTKEQGVKKP
ncbi:MAG: copper-binding protein [Terracidiphilus sp.]